LEGLKKQNVDENFGTSNIGVLERALKYDCVDWISLA
jgi:hypothetical protein